MTMTTAASLTDTLCALSTDLVTVTAIERDERTFVIEGCGADQSITAASAEAAAQEAAEWQHGADGAHAVTLTWRDAGSDASTVAVYDCEVDGEPVRRVTVRRG